MDTLTCNYNLDMYLFTSKWIPHWTSTCIHIYSMYFVLLTSQLHVVKNQELHDYYGISTMEKTMYNNNNNTCVIDS